MLSMFVFLFNYSQINDNVLRGRASKHKHKWRNLNKKESNESLFIDRCFFFPLTCFSLVTFPRNLAQIFRSDRSTYVRNIFFHSFYAFDVFTHFVAEEKKASLISIWLLFFNITPVIWILYPSFLKRTFNHKF